MKILGLIPARGGSKGVPHKNIIDINGKPLIVYTIETALRAKEKGLLEDVVVSTDDETIMRISMNAGASVPFIRPDYLSDDKAKSVDAIIHAIEFFKRQNKEYDAVMLLQPTTPLRNVEDICDAIEIFEKEKCDSLISCYKEEHIRDTVSYHKKGNISIPLSPYHNKGKRRQEEDDVYVRNGAIYLSKTNYILLNHLVFCDEPAIYVMPKNRSVNIDCMDDVEMLRWQLSK